MRTLLEHQGVSLAATAAETAGGGGAAATEAPRVKRQRLAAAAADDEEVVAERRGEHVHAEVVEEDGEGAAAAAASGTVGVVEEHAHDDAHEADLVGAIGRTPAGGARDGAIGRTPADDAAPRPRAVPGAPLATATNLTLDAASQHATLVRMLSTALDEARHTAAIDLARRACELGAPPPDETLLRLLGALFDAHETDSALSLYEMLRTTQVAHQRLKTRLGEGSGVDGDDGADGIDGDVGADADAHHGADADVTFVSRQVAFAVLVTVVP